MHADVSLECLLQRPDVWRATAAVRRATGIATGHRRLDQQLQQGGWPCAGLTELLCDGVGRGELRLLLPALVRLSQQGRKLVFVNPPLLPYAPAWQRQGVDLAQLVLIRTRDPAEQIWSAVQVLRGDGAGALLLWPARGVLRPSQLRKLQLAAQNNSGMAVVFRPVRAGSEASPALLRLVLSAVPGTCQVRILKQRGGPAGQCVEIAAPEGLGGVDRGVREPPLPLSATASAARPLPPGGRPMVVMEPQGATVWRRPPAAAGRA